MIGKVSGQFDPTLCCYDSDGNPAAANSKQFSGVIGAGFVELIGRTDPKSIKGIDEDKLAAEEANAAPTATAESSATTAKRKKSKKPREQENVYEYAWSVAAQSTNNDWFYSLNEDDSIVVQLIFHSSRSKIHVAEIAASLKQISPYCRTEGQKIMDWVKSITPFIDITGKALSAGGLSAPGKIVSTISKIKLNSLPINAFPWYVKTFSSESEPGIEWHIPYSVVLQTGNRISGSIGLSFIDSESAVCVNDRESDVDETAENQAPLTPYIDIEIKAFLRPIRNQSEVFLSPTDRQMLLRVTPI